MAKLTARAEKRNVRATRAPGMGGSSPPQGEGETVLGTKTIFERKNGKDGRIEKCKCSFVAQGFRQTKGVYYNETSSPTPPQASIRVVLGIAAVKDWELHQLDVDMAYLEAGVREELHIELPEDYRDSCDQVGRLQTAMYGFVRAGLLWSKTFSVELASRGFEQCQADPCVFWRVLRGKVVVIILIYFDDLLVASETQRDEEQAMKDLRFCFPIKDSREAGIYLGCHITRDRDAGTLKLDQHRYVRTVASKFHVEKTSTTPAAAGENPCPRTMPHRPRRRQTKCVSLNIGRR